MSELDDLRAQSEALQSEKEDLLALYRAKGAEAVAVNDQIVALERVIADDAALDELRERGGIDGAVAARTIAATMPDSERAARFTALADELLA